MKETYSIDRTSLTMVAPIRDGAFDTVLPTVTKAFEKTESLATQYH